MGDLARAGPLNLAQLPMNSPVGGGIPFAPPGSGGPVIPFVPEDGGGVIPGIPEPATWTLMVFGFGLVGAAVRRNNRKPGLSNDKDRSEEHTSELQSLMRISYAVFCLKKKKKPKLKTN